MYSIFIKTQEVDIMPDFKNKEQTYFMTWCQVTGTCIRVKAQQKIVFPIVINDNMMKEKLHSFYILWMFLLTSVLSIPLMSNEWSTGSWLWSLGIASKLIETTSSSESNEGFQFKSWFLNSGKNYIQYNISSCSSNNNRRGSNFCCHCYSCYY